QLTRALHENRRPLSLWRLVLGGSRHENAIVVGPAHPTVWIARVTERRIARAKLFSDRRRHGLGEHEVVLAALEVAAKLPKLERCRTRGHDCRRCANRAALGNHIDILP